MKKALILLMAGVFALGLFSLAQAGKPNTGGDDPVFIGNGYPSGAHYNLNIHGKKDDFNCSPESWECTVPDGLGGFTVTKYDNQTDCNTCADVPDGVCSQVFGNVINVPYYADPFQILMESGRKGPKGNPGATELEVTDSCAGFAGHDNASFRLPANADGYAVYARITGKPGEAPEDTFASFTSPDFVYVEDEDGNDLIYLGQIIGTTIATLTDEEIIIYRNTATKGNKVSKATDISRLFSYTGDVCYVNSVNSDGFDYCYDETQNPTDVCDPYQLCCDSQTIIGDDPDTTEVDESTNCAFFNDVAVDYGSGYECPNVVEVEPYLPYLIEVDCRTYTDEWVFNIADFVGMLWEIVNNNSYNIKIRFYPLPLDTKVKP